jgi:hypothetical protein
MQVHQTTKMKRTAIIPMILMAVMIGSFSISGCYYDVEEELYGGNTCDTMNITYSGTVKNLLNNYGCSGCHTGGSPPAGVVLDNHAGVKLSINRVWGAINHSTGFKPMPDGGAKMNQCDINKIGIWMNAGAPNN